jgi:NAD(P)H-flavin reductase
MMLILSAILMRVMVRSRRLAYSDSPQRNQNEVDNYDEDSDDENVAILLKNVFVKFVGSVRSTIKDTLRSVKGTLQSIDPPTLPALPNPLDLFGGRIHESDYVDTTDWNVCTLRKRKALSGGYQQYSFSLPNPRGVLDLDLGEEVQLCCVDAKDNVVKESVFPLTKSKQRGQFDVIIQQSGDVATDRFAKALQKCAVGDELAFKGGQRKLRYNEPADPDTRKDGPIELVTLVASSLGIAPAMKMIRTSVEDSDDTTVDEVEVLWVNQDDNDFVCDDDLSALENKFEKQLYVTRLTEPALYDAEADLLTNEDVLSRLVKCMSI